MLLAETQDESILWAEEAAGIFGLKKPEDLQRQLAAKVVGIDYICVSNCYCITEQLVTIDLDNVIHAIW